jgi:hypothetical protein
MLKAALPLSYEAWIDYDVCGTRLSRMELDALRGLVAVNGGCLSARAGQELGPEALAEFGLSKREIDELAAKLAPAGVPDFTLDPALAKSGDEFAERYAAAVPSAEPPPIE